MGKMTLADITEMRKLMQDPKNGGSDRQRDKQRSRLKRLGYIVFSRVDWEWKITPAGRSALGASHDE